MTASALLYARISVTDAKVPKVANQLSDLRKLANARSYAIAGEYVDDGLSAAKAENRPDFDRLLTDLAAHPGAVILATEEARLARNEMEKAGLMLACARVGATWETVQDGAVDPATASGALMATLRGGIDAFESRRKAERQKAANLHRREKGLHYTNGPAPFGWNDDRITVNEAQAELIRSGTAALLAGRSVHQIAKEWRESDVPPPRAGAWTRVSVLMTLRRWRNASVVAYKDEPLREEAAKGKTKPYKIGQWDPIVPVEDLEAARAIILAKSGNKRVASRLCSGIARCSCGEYMIASGSNGTRAYMCSARVRGIAKPGTVHSGIKAEMLEEVVRAEVIANYFRTPVGTGAAQAEAQTLTDLYESRSKALSAIGRLMDQVEAGTFKDSEIAPRVARRRQEVDDLDAQIAKLAADSAHAAILQASMNEMWADFDVETVMTNSWDDIGLAMVQSEMKRGATREEAINIVAASEWAGLGKDGEPVWQVDPKIQAAVARRFDTLPLEQQRNLVKSLLTITVAPGRGTDRVAIEPL